MSQDQAVTTDTAISVDWPEALDAYGVEVLVLDPHHDRELLDLFRSQPGWRVDFEDEEMALLVRAGSAHGDTGRATPPKPGPVGARSKM
ncbi:MAG: hypothetical protein P8186_12625 [Anaerolineae bacterium]|jgi:hypothetical protein